ncbi:MAG: SDR family oxidoreductase [Cupriavidus sp.]|nr:SDR family oxidoreductase [Cupriavidus sp.]
MSNTILVMGATGTVGRELATQLKGAGANVIAMSSTGKAVEGVETRHGDLADPKSLASALRGVDVLFLLLPLQRNMADLARNAIAAAKAAGVSHIVRSSGAGADPGSPAAIGRVQGEIDELVAQSGIAYTLTRPNCFMQNFLTFYGDMIRAGTLYLAQGDGKVSFIDARDIAAVNASILQHPAAHAGKIYTLTGGKALSNADVTQCIGAALGRSISYVAVPDDAAISSMRDAGVDEWSIDTLMSLNRVIAAGYTAEVSPDVENLLGRAPITFETFVADHLASWRQ